MVGKMVAHGKQPPNQWISTDFAGSVRRRPQDDAGAANAQPGRGYLREWQEGSLGRRREGPKVDPVADEPTQETQPAKGEPVKIPVPKKADVLADLKKAAQAQDQPAEPPKGDA